jgi:hypothetical protein
MKKMALIFIITLLLASCTNYTPQIKEDLHQCENVIDWGECKLTIAIEHQEKAVCNEINNRYYKEVCKILVTKKFSRCDKIEEWDFSERNPKPGDYQDMKAYARSQARAIFIPTKAATKETCYTWSAILSKDQTKCEKITSTPDKEACYNKYATEVEQQ